MIETLRVSNVVYCFNVNHCSGHFAVENKGQNFSSTFAHLIDEHRNHSWHWRPFVNYGVLTQREDISAVVRFVVFPTSGHVNCVGNRNFHTDVEKSIASFNHFIGNEWVRREDCRIVNSTLTGRLCAGNLSLHHLVDQVFLDRD